MSMERLVIHVSFYISLIRYDQLFDVLPKCVHKSLTAFGPPSNMYATFLLCHDSDQRPTDVVHVINGRVGVQCDSVELVRVFHRYGCAKCLKIVVLDGLNDVAHPVGDNGDLGPVRRRQRS